MRLPFLPASGASSFLRRTLALPTPLGFLDTPVFLLFCFPTIVNLELIFQVTMVQKIEENPIQMKNTKNDNWFRRSILELQQLPCAQDLFYIHSQAVKLTFLA
jgi:hypothetical protein